MKKNATAIIVATINSVSWPSNICRIDSDFAGSIFRSRELSTGATDFAGGEAFDGGRVWILAGVFESGFFVDSFCSVGVLERAPGSEVCAAASFTNFQEFS